MADNTIFDDVFKTMVEKMPHLVVPLINEVFGTSYPEDICIERLDNEQHGKDGRQRRSTDSRLKIGSKIYHIECQSTEDKYMVIRMVEYDFWMGLETVEKTEKRYRITFPHSCILNLRGQGHQKQEELEIIMPDGTELLYKVPILWLKDYTSNVIFQKHLLFLLPFYIIKYEKNKKQLAEDDQYLQIMLDEYREIQEYLSQELNAKNDSISENNCRNLIDLIKRIADYIFQNEEKVKKGVNEIMGGRILELATEREERERREFMEKFMAEYQKKAQKEIRAEVQEKVRKEIRAEVQEKVQKEIRAEEQESLLLKLIQKKLQKNKSISVIAEELEMDEAEIRNLIQKM